MNNTEIKKALYKQKPTAHYLTEDYEYLEYGTTLEDETEVIFRVPRDEAFDEVGHPLLNMEEPAQLLIRWLT